MSDAGSHLHRPEFWAVHYGTIVGRADPESVTPSPAAMAAVRDSSDVIGAVFEIPADRLAAYYQSIHKAEAEAQLFAVPVVAGYDVGIQVVDCGEDGRETRYSVGHTDWPEREQLGYDSPHFALPAFRWTEVERIARAIEPRSPDDAARAILLLFPAVYITRGDDAAVVARTLANAWKQAGLPDRAEKEGLVRNAVENRSVPELTWRADPDLGWINDGDYSFRNPLTLMTAFEPRRFERVRSFLEAVESAAS